MNAAAAPVLLVLLAGPLDAEAQPTEKVYRLGVLATAVSAETLASFATRLRPLGYVEGRNLVVDGRSADGKLDRLPGLARELVQLRVDVIMAVGNDAIQAARDATRTIPIVMGYGNAPI